MSIADNPTWPFQTRWALHVGSGLLAFSMAAVLIPATFLASHWIVWALPVDLYPCLPEHICALSDQGTKAEMQEIFMKWIFLVSFMWLITLGLFVISQNFRRRLLFIRYTTLYIACIYCPFDLWLGSVLLLAYFKLA